MPRLLILLLVLAGSATMAEGQVSVRATNPGMLELVVPPGSVNNSQQTTYRVEVFPASADLRVALPVRTTDVSARVSSSGRAPLDLRRLLDGLEPGEYVATVSTLQAGIPSERSAPTAPFAIANAAANETAKGTNEAAAVSPVGNAASSAAANQPPPDVPVPATPEDEKRERFWTRVAIAIGAAAILLPFLF